MSSSGVPSMQSTLRTLSVVPVDAQKLDGGERDRVGPHRRAQGEGAARAAQMRRHLLDQIAPRLVHPIEQPEVAVEAQVLEASRKARIELDPADGVQFGGIPRALGARLERRADTADEIHAGVIGKLAARSPPRQAARRFVPPLPGLPLPRRPRGWRENGPSFAAFAGPGQIEYLAHMKRGPGPPDAPVAQLDRVSPSEGEGHRFEILSGAPNFSVLKSLSFPNLEKSPTGL